MSRWPANLIAVPCVFIGVTLWDGAGYTFGPPRVSASRSLAAFDQWPGGIRTYGVLLLLTCLTLTVGLLRHHLPTVRVGLAMCVGAFTALTVSVLGSWAMYGVQAWGGPSKGAGLALLAAMILRRTPEGERE